MQAAGGQGLREEEHLQAKMLHSDKCEGWLATFGSPPHELVVGHGCRMITESRHVASERLMYQQSVNTSLLLSMSKYYNGLAAIYAAS